MSEMAKKEKITFTDMMRGRLKGILEPIAQFLINLGIYPNTITLLGLVGNVFGAYLISQGRMTAGGLVIMATGPFDALDGTMARLKGESSDWGAFVDSVSDRYAELFTFAGLLYFYLTQNNLTAMMWVYAAAVGSVMVSYVRSRAQALGFDIKQGLFSRFERYIVLIPSLVLNFPLVGMIILGIGANFTALQRIYEMRNLAKK